MGDSNGGDVPSTPSSHPGFAQVGPHSFHPLRFWDDLHANGRCRACLIPRSAHPVHGYVGVRPWGDKSKAVLTWEALHGGPRP